MRKTAYPKPKYALSSLTTIDVKEGETLEMKIERILANKEPIKDGAPEIFTERKDGVLPGFNIRTDRWEIATEAMDKVHRSNQAKRDEKMKGQTEPEKETKVIDLNQDGETKPTQGKEVK